MYWIEQSKWARWRFRSRLLGCYSNGNSIINSKSVSSFMFYDYEALQMMIISHDKRDLNFLMLHIFLGEIFVDFLLNFSLFNLKIKNIFPANKSNKNTKFYSFFYFYKIFIYFFISLFFSFKIMLYCLLRLNVCHLYWFYMRTSSTNHILFFLIVFIAVNETFALFFSSTFF